MHRRSFLRLLAAGAVGAAVAPETLIEPARLYFDLGAKPHFTGALTLPEWVIDEQLAAVKRNMDISIRLMKEYSAEFYAAPTRFDVLYGMGTLKPNHAIRLTDEDRFELGQTVQARLPQRYRPSPEDFAQIIRDAAKHMAARIDAEAAERAYGLLKV